MASIRVIFMGSVFSIVARVAAGSLLLPRAAKQPLPVFFKKDLLLSLTVAPYFNGITRCRIESSRPATCGPI